MKFKMQIWHLKLKWKGQIISEVKDFQEQTKTNIDLILWLKAYMEFLIDYVNKKGK